MATEVEKRKKAKRKVKKSRTKADGVKNNSTIQQLNNASKGTLFEMKVEARNHARAWPHKQLFGREKPTAARKRGRILFEVRRRRGG